MRGRPVATAAVLTGRAAVNAWFKARVIEHKGDRYRIRYLEDDGTAYDPQFDEWLPPTCLRPVRSPRPPSSFLCLLS